MTISGFSGFWSTVTGCPCSLASRAKRRRRDTTEYTPDGDQLVPSSPVESSPSTTHELTELRSETNAPEDTCLIVQTKDAETFLFHFGWHFLVVGPKIVEGRKF
jgi:hypothetical protein